MNRLEMIKLGASGPLFSRIGMGCWAVGGHGWGPVNDDESIKALEAAYRHGVTFFDTADCYGLGKSERILKQALGSRLKSLFVASKGGVRWDDSGRVWNDSSPAYLRTAVEASLRRLGLEQIPLYYLHKPDDVTPISEVMGGLVRLREEGKIGEIGVANVTAEQLSEAIKVAPVRFVQDQYNLLHRDRFLALNNLCQRFDIYFVAWGALADGLLTGKCTEQTTFGVDDHRSRLPAFCGELYLKNLAIVDKLKPIANKYQVTLSQLALRWVMDSFEKTCPLFGAKTAQQVDENVGASGWRLTTTELELIDTYAEYNVNTQHL